MNTTSQPPSGWGMRLALLSLATAFIAPSSALAGNPSAEYGKGDVDKGRFFTELYRGAAVPFELMVAATPNDCH